MSQQPEPWTIEGDLWGIEGGLMITHTREQCAGSFCALHNPSNHPLRDAVMKWDPSRNLMVRFCAHGIWHPDPDDVAYKHRSTSAYWASMCELHHCDRCCGYPHKVGEIEAITAASTRDKAAWAWIAFCAWVRSLFGR